MTGQLGERMMNPVKNLRNRVITRSVLRDCWGVPLWIQLAPSAWRRQWASLRIQRQHELGAMRGGQAGESRSAVKR